MAEEKTLESLQAELDSANAKIAAQTTEIDNHATTVAELNSKIAEQAEIITDLNKEVDTLSKQKTVAVPVVEFEGKSYAIVIPKFNHKGVDVTAAELEKDSDMIAELIKQGSGVLELKK